MDRLELSLEHASWLEGVRKIPCELAAEMGVVSKGGNIAFEYRRNGQCLSRKIRKEIVASGGRTKTFAFDPVGIEKLFWNEDALNEPSRPDTPLIITEGEIDALSFMAAGATHVLSVPNGSPMDKPGKGEIVPADDNAFSYLWEGGRLRPGFEKFRKIILATDGDRKGKVLAEELAVRLGRSRCWYVTYPDGCKDANEVLVQHGLDALTDLIVGAKPIVPNRLVPFSDIPQRADLPRYSSGWWKLDKHLILVPPEMVIITGSPGAGKSQWSIALCANLARVHGLKGAILQFEDNPERNRRDLFAYARAWHGQQKHGIDEDPAKWIDRMFRTIAPSEDVDDYNLAWVQNAIEEATTRHGAKWVLIDPWNEIEHLWRINETETAYTNQALRELKRLARRFQIILMIVAHPSKGGAMSKGIDDLSLYDVSGSAAWKNKADHGVIVYRETSSDVVTQIKIDKSKDFLVMGRPGTVQMRYLPDKATFECLG